MGGTADKKDIFVPAKNSSGRFLMPKRKRPQWEKGGRKMNEYRTHNCGELRIEDVGKEVKIAGFVETIRDLGGLVF